MSKRAEALASRIEQGAAELAAFAESLSDQDWNTPISNTDQRTVGVIVHHVAIVYPLEVQAARVTASGKPLLDVTFDTIKEMNAKHATQNDKVTKSDVLSLLLTNSRAAAQEVRTFTDEQLDQAAPFGLSFGAPVTAQFVIEDHALRHSWHHLAGIRKAIGK
jgi:hypothetical protein